MVRVPDIELTQRELELASQIHFGSLRHEELHASIVPMVALVESLLQRGAVPDVRLLYFTDPERNPGGRGKSRLQVFESNGTSGSEIYAHPSFMKYLEYFIFGPNLTPSMLAKFRESMEFSGYLSYSDVSDLIPAARAYVRNERLDPQIASEEFHKLVLECNGQPSCADGIRKQIRSIRLG